MLDKFSRILLFSFFHKKNEIPETFQIVERTIVNCLEVL